MLSLNSASYMRRRTFSLEGVGSLAALCLMVW
jgi:hypothetical protein